MQPVVWAAAGTGFTCLMTVLGASVVFFFRKKVTAGIQRIFLGFAAGVMVAASVWSLLIPAMEEAESQGMPGWLPTAGGFLLGWDFSWPWTLFCPTCTWGPTGRKATPPPGSAPPCWCLR